MTTIKPLMDIISKFQLPEGDWKILSEQEFAPDEKVFIIQNIRTQEKFFLTENPTIAGKKDINFYHKWGFDVKQIVPRQKATLFRPTDVNDPIYGYSYEYYEIFTM